jgi:metal-sulfur cluster biosynthetic enzyme
VSAAVDEALVRSVLNGIVDPCSEAAGAPAGLDDMGLVRSVEISESAAGTTVRVEIGVTEPGCFMIYPFCREARERLAGIERIDTVEVDLANGADWMPSDMSEAYRKLLTRKRAVREAALGLEREQVEVPVKVSK